MVARQRRRIHIGNCTLDCLRHAAIPLEAKLPCSLVNRRANLLRRESDPREAGKLPIYCSSYPPNQCCPPQSLRCTSRNLPRRGQAIGGLLVGLVTRNGGRSEEVRRRAKRRW